MDILQYKFNLDTSFKIGEWRVLHDEDNSFKLTDKEYQALKTLPGSFEIPLVFGIIVTYVITFPVLTIMVYQKKHSYLAVSMMIH